MRHLRAFAPALLFALASLAPAQLATPTVQAGQFVYTIPESFAPPLIERSGVAELNRELAKLKFPLYVVLTSDLPGSSQLANLTPSSGEYNRLRAKLADEAVIGLTNRFRAQSRFDQNRASVFLLTFKPKSFAYRPGSEWKVKYGFVTDAHTPYIDLFKKYASNPANDPKQGILEMAKAIDAHLDDLSNPAKIAARALGAANKRYEIQRIDAQNVLNTGRELGLDMDELQTAIRKADDADHRTAARLDQATTNLQSAVERLRLPVEQRQAEVRQAAAVVLQAVQEKQRKEAAASQRQTTIFALIGLTLFGGGYVTLSRRRRLQALQAELKQAVARNRERITNARQQAFRLLQERDAIAGAAKFQGRTKEVYDHVAADVDALTVGLEAMANHTDANERLGAKATFRDLSPLEKAVREIDEEFDFDTGKVNRNDLYGDPTQRVTIVPREFLPETKKRFEATSAAWERLKHALDLRGKAIEGELPHSRLDELTAEAQSLGLDPQWFAAHPLSGDDASDQAAYTSIADLLWEDPVAGLDRIEEVRKWEDDTAAAFARIREASGNLIGTRLTEVPVFPTAPVAPGDDPATLLRYAREADDAYRRTLATSHSADEIVDAAEEATLSYNLCHEAIENLRKAIQEAPHEVAALAQPLEAAQKRCDLAETAVVETSRRHRGTGTARSFASDAEIAVRAAREDASAARQALEANRHLEASRRAAACREHLAQAESKSGQAIALCDELEEARERYEAKVREMSMLRSTYADQVSRYGSRYDIDPFRAPAVSGPSDYGLLYGLLTQQQAHWQSQVDAARSAYEAAQEAERQRSSWSSSSSSSSSDSSWSSSSSSSSGDSSGGFSDSGSSSSSSGDSSGGW